MSNSILKISLISLLFLGFFACVKHDFDTPPVGGEDPNLVANITIKQLKGMHTTGQFEKITDDLIAVGIVTMDDKSGNYYKTFVIQDETAGIEVKINASDQYIRYPVGRRVFVKLKGLTLGDYNGVIQLGGNTYLDAGQTKLGGIETTVATNYLFPGKYDQLVVPKKVKINELTADDISTLITLENVEFITADAGTTYADVINKATVNRTIQDCAGNKVLLRTSGFASFAGGITPNGNGSITAIYSVYGTDKQLYIRDLRDVDMTAVRCNGSGGGVSANTTIAALKALHTSKFNVINTDIIIEGTVTADDKSGNFYKEIAIQDATGGLGVKINVQDIYQTYPVGSKIAIKCKGLTLGDDSGITKLGGNTYTSNGNELLGGLDATQLGANVVYNGTGTPSAKSSTINSLSDNDLSNLVILNDVQFVSGDVEQSYADAVGKLTVNRLVEDCDGNTITIRTSGYADFAASLTPGGKGTITGIYETFGTTKQLYIRNASDAVMTGSRCSGGGNPGTDEINESFDGLPDNVDLVINGWYNIAEVGTRLWRGKLFSGNYYAQATSFNSVDPVNTYWLITPGLDLTVAHTLSFESAKSFWKHDGLSVWFSTDFNGSNVKTATWTQINATLAKQSDADNTFIPSGTIDLPIVTSGKGYVAFKYTGDNVNNTSTYRVDNVIIKKK